MSEETRAIFKQVAEGADSDQDYPGELGKDRDELFKQSAQTAAYQILREAGSELAEKRKILFGVIFKHSLPAIDRLVMNKKEQYYFAYLVMSELAGWIPKEEV